MLFGTSNNQMCYIFLILSWVACPITVTYSIALSMYSHGFFRFLSIPLFYFRLLKTLLHYLKICYRFVARAKSTFYVPHTVKYVFRCASMFEWTLFIPNLLLLYFLFTSTSSSAHFFWLSHWLLFWIDFPITSHLMINVLQYPHFMWMSFSCAPFPITSHPMNSVLQ